MNYRHIYHAGNFADVLKHAVLALVIEHMKLKEGPFRVIDTHAGTGLYDLTSGESEKTGEWQDGIGSLLPAAPPAEIAAMLAPYLDVVRAENDGGDRIVRYPGSPQIARRLMRPVDRLVVNEAHPEDADRLAALFAKDRQTKVLALDGWTALKALLPPKERRGVVLIDPPFEEPGEFKRLLEGLTAAHRRFATGTVILWYPIKNERAAAAFSRDAAALGIPKLLSAELFIDTPRDEGPLVATGLLILNPPFTLGSKLAVLLPYLTALFARGKGAENRLAWLAGERVTSS
ncbi:23S rRNA (adenine(2030)-N(6))-methyltransferase RlmJ [Hyphomicrobium sp.]|uniref:23S rRNA (adenine(2030)-N(6))-methyltransferase RlmJ n=1 Tax=Hyphomicrobium sp. TaxID=82 RepID=UPI0025B8FF80|nr:23S rRNA (adenine(2030)-N(6))-methyltransferase RlmJ [Hyphomicrobium sp.]MCC7250709.1 23S rRNA (adenine(2030)-N(6))-methyltransferase RlmJ [Hyphomicrobium sp.]